MPARGRKRMVANAIGHSFDRTGGVSSREPGGGLVCLRTARLDADSFGHRFPSRTGHRCGQLHWPHTGNRTGRGGVNRGRLPDRFHRPERTTPNPACHPELDSGSPRGGRGFVRGDTDTSEANARPESESGRTAEGVLRIGRMTSPAARGGTMRTTGDDLWPCVVRARMGNASPWAERDGGQCDGPQLRQGGRCLQS
jgi:hypothetical protein